jgi:hypothetical protein
VGEEVAPEIKAAHLQVRYEGGRLPLADFILLQHLAAIAKNHQGERSSSQDVSAGVKIDHIAPRQRRDVAE